MEWLYTRTTLRGRGGLSTALPTGKGRGNRHKREVLQPKGKRRRGSMKVFSSHLHMDEQTPHIHIDFVPFIRDSRRGLDTRVSLKGALSE